MMIRSNVLSGIFALLCLAGCGTQPVSTSLTATLLTAGAYCGHMDTAGKAVWLDNAAELHAVYDAINRQRLGESPAWPEVDFMNYGVIAVFMGLKSTGGYTLALENQEVPINKKVAELRLISGTPSPDQFTVQVITSPCLLIKMPKAGYSAVRIVDRGGSLHYALELP